MFMVLYILRGVKSIYCTNMTAGYHFGQWYFQPPHYSHNITHFKYIEIVHREMGCAERSAKNPKSHCDRKTQRKHMHLNQVLLVFQIHGGGPTAFMCFLQICI